MNERIITSLLDTDLYKLTMMQVIKNRYSSAIAEHKFVCRNEGINLAKYVPEIREQIDYLCELQFREDELRYLRQRTKFLKRDFIDLLEMFKFKKSHIQVHANPDGTSIDITTRGPLWQIMLFEVFVLSIVNEVYFKDQVKNLSSRDTFNIQEEGFKRLEVKMDSIKELDGFVFTDFGTRRRFSKEWQYDAVDYCKKVAGDKFFGTSNVYLARELDINPVGTMAHEYLQAFQSFPGTQLANSQRAAFEAWSQEYRGELGIALTDVIGIDAFLKDFDLFFAKLFDGVRHDSGSPYVWADKIIDHYKKLKIDPKTKLLVFSDGLTFPKAIDLYNTYKDQTKMSFGIGTNLTNDVGFKPLNIVMKITRCNNLPVAKISDSEGKTICEDQVFVDYLRKVFTEKPTLFENVNNDYE